MPARTKKHSGKKVPQVQIIIGEQCTFIEPMATSSPNDRKVVEESSRAMNLVPSRNLKMLYEKEIKEQEDKKNEFVKHINYLCDFLLLNTSPDSIYYICKDEQSEKKEYGKNKRQREEDSLMPPPSQPKKAVKRTSKKHCIENEDLRPPMRTRSSSRLTTQSINSKALNEVKSEVPQDDFKGFKTPALRGILRRNRHNIATVTPGPNVNAPQTILRRPNPGETAISLSGSPLLVSSEQTSAVPQITIPLRDGRVMAVLAKDGLNPSDFPAMDSQTLSRLKVLQEFLGKL